MAHFCHSTKKIDFERLFKRESEEDNDDEDDDYDTGRRKCANDNIKFISRRNKVKDLVLYGSDDEDSDNSAVRKKKVRSATKRTIVELGPSAVNQGIILCLDVNLTLVDKRDKPYPSVRKLYETVKSGLNKFQVYIVLYTHANDNYMISLLEKDLSFFEPDLIITRDDLTKAGFEASYDKPVTLLRRMLTQRKLLSFATAIVDDVEENLDPAQYDIVLPVYKYYRWTGDTATENYKDAVDVDYPKLIRHLIDKANTFFANKDVR